MMVARGDLGVEIPMERVPQGAKRLIVDKANAAGKGVVIATQMLRSMVISPTPTRAEVSRTSATPCWRATDAILLSDETAMGQYPVEALRVAVSTINEAESEESVSLLQEHGHPGPYPGHHVGGGRTGPYSGLQADRADQHRAARRWNWPGSVPANDILAFLARPNRAAQAVPGLGDPADRRHPDSA